ncbi:hypothetical protein TOPH_06337 [Tolypocladium ophioglossoides CBS 100239]|uniref:Uncharacterized protein n=1 Tax=Tolypocladium ophioglossoides (strain CBS 100239) TaxID=1163406 RepID=A0A0L0N5F4_TOLOC|nr:hypothetical protein TOPH_06337 [Tolypocladium ophioglossoides CBS 100239]
MGVQYVLVGPARLFKQDIYLIIPYGYLFGAVAAAIMFALHKKSPRAKLLSSKRPSFSAACPTSTATSAPGSRARSSGDL